MMGMVLKQNSGSIIHRAGRAMKTAGIIAVSTAFLMTSDGILLARNALAEPDDKQKQGEKMGAPGTRNMIDPAKTDLEKIVDINDIKNVVTRLMEISKSEHPEKHAGEIKQIYDTWRYQIREPKYASSMGKFHRYLFEIRNRLERTDPQAYQEIFGSLQQTGETKGRDLRGVRINLRTPTDLEHIGDAPHPPESVTGWTFNEVPLKFFTNFIDAVTKPVADQIGLLFSRALAEQAKNDGRPTTESIRLGNEIADKIEHAPDFSIGNLKDALEYDSEKKAWEWLSHMRQGNPAGTLGIQEQSAWNRNMLENFNEVLSGAKRTWISVALIIEVDKRWQPTGGNYAVDTGLKVTPMGVTTETPKINDDFELEYTRKTDGAVDLEANAALARVFSRYKEVRVSVAVEHIPSKLAPGIGATALNLIGKAELEAVDHSGKTIRLGKFSVYSGKIGVDTKGGISAETTAGLRFPQGFPAVLIMNGAWVMRQSEGIRRTPIVLRLGPKLEWKDKTGTPHHGFLYGKIGLEKGSFGEESADPFEGGNVNIGVGLGYTKPETKIGKDMKGRTGFTVEGTFTGERKSIIGSLIIEF